MTLVDFLREQEGFRATWYRDGPCWAIGYGHHSCNPDLSWRLTQTQALKLLKRDIQAASERAGRDFSAMMGYPITRLPKRHREALTELCFNLGTIRGFPRFVKALAEGDIETAIRESKRYAWVNGEKVELVRRNRAFVWTFLAGEEQKPEAQAPLAVTWPIWACWAKEALMRRVRV